MAVEVEKIKLTSSADIEKFKPGTSCQFIGYIDAIESEMRFPTSRVFKFILNNGAGTRVQVNCWNETIERVKALIIMDNIIYLEKARCTASTDYNRGSFQGAEITIGKYTNVETMGVFGEENCDIPATEPAVLQEFTLEAFNTSVLPSKLKTSGYLKTQISKIGSDVPNLAKGIFTITDGERKLDVTTNFYVEDHGYQRGDLLQLSGSIFYLKNEEVSFIIEKPTDIVKRNVEGERPKTLAWLLKGTEIIVIKNPKKKAKYH